MDELPNIKDHLDYTINKISNGTITTIQSDFGISYQSQIACSEKVTVIAINLYGKNELYNLAYACLDENGQVFEVLQETEGVLPNMFLNERKDIWCLLMDTSMDKSTEIIIPLKNRTDYNKPKGKKQFPGKYIGNAGNIALFLNCDVFFSESPDKLLKIELKNDQVKSQKQLKIPAPVNNKITTDKDGNLQLLARHNGQLLHRKCDINGNMLFKRTIPFPPFNSFEPIVVNENSDTRVVFTDDNKMCLSIISSDTTITHSVLFENQSDIFNIWEPVRLNENVYVIRFNFESGNGWLTLKNNKLLDCFIHSKSNGYKSTVSDEIISIPHDDLILAGISKVDTENYCVVLYPRNENLKENKEIILLNRQIQ